MNEKKICAIHITYRKFIPECIKNSYKSINNRQKNQEKNEKRLNIDFTKDNIK